LSFNKIYKISCRLLQHNNLENITLNKSSLP